MPEGFTTRFQIALLLLSSCYALCPQIPSFASSSSQNSLSASFSAVRIAIPRSAASKRHARVQIIRGAIHTMSTILARLKREHSEISGSVHLESASRRGALLSLVPLLVFAAVPERVLGQASAENNALTSIPREETGRELVARTVRRLLRERGSKSGLQFNEAQRLVIEAWSVITVFHLYQVSLAVPFTRWEKDTCVEREEEVEYLYSVGPSSIRPSSA